MWYTVSKEGGEEGVAVQWKSMVVKLHHTLLLCMYIPVRMERYCCTVDDYQVGYVNKVGHLSKTPLNLFENHEIGPVDTSESKQQNYNQMWHM